MAKHFPNLVKHKFANPRISANPKQNKFKENYTSAHPSQTIENHREKNLEGNLIIYGGTII